MPLARNKDYTYKKHSEPDYKKKRSYFLLLTDREVNLINLTTNFISRLDHYFLAMVGGMCIQRVMQISFRSSWRETRSRKTARNNKYSFALKHNSCSHNLLFHPCAGELS